MIPLPKWATDVLLEKKCPYCNVCFKPEWVCGVGVREIGLLGTKQSNNKSGLTVEYCCIQCGRISQIIIHSSNEKIDIKSLDIMRELFYTMCAKFIEENPIDINKIIEGMKEIYPGLKDNIDNFNEMMKDIEENSVKKNISSNSSNSNITHMTKEEVEDFIKNVEKMDHEDFMRYIGVPESEIKKHSKPKGEDNGKDK